MNLTHFLWIFFLTMTIFLYCSLYGSMRFYNIISCRFLRTFRISGCDVSMLKYVCIQMQTGVLRNTLLHLLIRDPCLVMPEMISVRTVSLRGREWARVSKQVSERERVADRKLALRDSLLGCIKREVNEKWQEVEVKGMQRHKKRKWKKWELKLSYRNVWTADIPSHWIHYYYTVPLFSFHPALRGLRDLERRPVTLRVLWFISNQCVPVSSPWAS